MTDVATVRQALAVKDAPLVNADLAAASGCSRSSRSPNPQERWCPGPAASDSGVGDPVSRIGSGVQYIVSRADWPKLLRVGDTRTAS